MPNRKPKTENRKPKSRLDHLLVARGLAETRAKAQALILAGRVLVAGVAETKAGTLVPADAQVTLKPPPQRYVRARRAGKRSTSRR